MELEVLARREVGHPGPGERLGDVGEPPQLPSAQGACRDLHANHLHAGLPLAVYAVGETGGAAPPGRPVRVGAGEQFVVVAVGGGGAWGAGDYVVAFRLKAE